MNILTLFEGEERLRKIQRADRKSIAKMMIINIIINFWK